MPDWDKVEVDARVEIKLPGQTLNGTVTEVHGRLLRGDTVEPGWARVKPDDGAEVVVAQAQLGDVLDS